MKSVLLSLAALVLAPVAAQDAPPPGPAQTGSKTTTRIVVVPTTGALDSNVQLGLGATPLHLDGSLYVRTAPAERQVLAGAVDASAQGALGLVSRIAVSSPAPGVDLAAFLGGSLVVGSGTATRLADSGDAGARTEQQRWSGGLAALGGLEVVGWLSGRVGVVLSVHQRMGVPGLVVNPTETVRITDEPGVRGLGIQSGPRLEQTRIGVGVRLGRPAGRAR